MGRVENYLNAYLEQFKAMKEREHPTPPADNVFYASQAGGCMRKVYFEKILGRRDFDIVTRKKMLVGDIIHDFFQEHVLPKGEGIANEPTLKIEQEGLVIVGHADHVEMSELDELKSTAWLSFSEEKPDDGHVRQLMLYMKALNRSHGQVTYIEKASFKIVEHAIKFSEKIYDETIEGFKRIYTAVLTKKSPERLEGFPNDWHCHQKKENIKCPYFEECERTKPGESGLPATEAQDVKAN